MDDLHREPSPESNTQVSWKQAQLASAPFYGPPPSNLLFRLTVVGAGKALGQKDQEGITRTQSGHWRVREPRRPIGSYSEGRMPRNKGFRLKLSLW